MGIVFVGDLHFRDQEPYYEAGLRFIDWFESQDFNNEENVLVQLGDVTHNSILNGRVVRMFLNRFLENLKFKQVYILQGNHDVDNKSKTSVLEPMKDISGVTVIDEPTVVDIEGVEFLCMPHLISSDMNKIYADVYSYLGIDGDPKRVVLTHVADESQTLFGKYIDLSYLKEKRRISGHVHKASANYIGTPFHQRYDEREERSKVVVYENGEYQDRFVHPIIQFVSVKYGEDIDSIESIPVLDITDAPSIDAAHERYKDYFIRKVFLSEETDSILKTTTQESDEMTLIDYFNEFAQDRNLTDFESTKVIEKIQKR